MVRGRYPKTDAKVLKISQISAYFCLKFERFPELFCLYYKTIIITSSPPSLEGEGGANVGNL